MLCCVYPFLHGGAASSGFQHKLSWDVVVPIYAYKCSSCHHAQDVLQKMSDPILTVCPECEQDTYVKQVTAAGFQLKGTGWYVTDFRDNKSGATGATAPAATVGESASASAPSSPAAAPAASPAASSTTS